MEQEKEKYIDSSSSGVRTATAAALQEGESALEIGELPGTLGLRHDGPPSDLVTAELQTIIIVRVGCSASRQSSLPRGVQCQQAVIIVTSGALSAAGGHSCHVW